MWWWWELARSELGISEQQLIQLSSLKFHYKLSKVDLTTVAKLIAQKTILLVVIQHPAAGSNVYFFL